MRLLYALGVCVLLAIPMIAQGPNPYTLSCDPNTDNPTGYRVYEGSSKIREAPACEWLIQLAPDDGALHTYGITAYKANADGSVTESAKATATLQQTVMPAPAPEPIPDPTPQPPVPTQPESTDGTILPPATSIVDATGTAWTLDMSVPQKVLRNGQADNGGFGSKILYVQHAVYVFGTDSNWWKWSGGWVNVGSAQPGAPIPTPTPTPVPAPQPPPVPTWKCSIPSAIGSYANGDDKVTLRCPKSFPGIKGNTVTVSVP